MTGWFASCWRRCRLAGVVLMCAVLAACALPTPDGDGPAGAYTRVGRFALNVTSPGTARQAVQGGFVWRDNGRSLRLDLANPLGTILARVDADDDHAVLTRSDGTQTTADNADALVADVLGSAMPVTGLRDWLHGRQASGQVTDLQRDSEGRLEHFVEDGWQVRMSRYDEQGPRLLRMARQQAGKSIDVRLVID